MRKIAGIRAGRPDYCFTSTIPIAPATPAGVQQIYWNASTNVPPRSEVCNFPTDFSYNTFPRPGKVFKIKKVVVSTDADILIGVDLLHVTHEGWVKYRRGEITFTEMLQKYTYSFATELGYQRVEVRPELYAIPYPDVFMYGVVNEDPENARTVYVQMNGEEHVKA